MKLFMAGVLFIVSSAYAMDNSLEKSQNTVPVKKQLSKESIMRELLNRKVKLAKDIKPHGYCFGSGELSFMIVRNSDLIPDTNECFINY